MLTPVIPPSDAWGVLPPGDHAATFAELRASPLVFGPTDRPDEWDEDWRDHLVSQAEILVRQLWAVGVTEVFLDGSFAEDKPRPNDVDGYFTCDLRRFASGELQRELNALDPHSVWTWDPRRPPAPPRLHQEATPRVARLLRRALPALRRAPVLGDR